MTIPGGGPRIVGKRQGVVRDTADPLQRGRVMVLVPSVSDSDIGWCEPAMPVVGDKSGFYAVPPQDSSVWVEWPDGDIGKPPIWSGGSWTSTSQPPNGASPDVLLIVTPGGHRIALSDADETITLTASGGASITLGPDGIVLDNGQGATVELASATVALNDQSLRVTG